MRNLFCRFASFSFLLIFVFFCFHSASAQGRCEQKKADNFLAQAQTAIDQRDYEKAVSLADNAAKSAPRCPIPLELRGLAFDKLNKLEDAINAYREAIKLNSSKTANLQTKICEIQFERLKYTEAVIDCRQATFSAPNSESAYYSLAQAHQQLNEDQEALSAISKAAEINPKNFDYRMMKAKLLSKLQKKNEALPDFLAATEIKPTSAEAFAGLGETYAGIKEYTKAKNAYQKAVELNPNDFYSWVQLGSMCATLGNPGDAQTFQQWRDAEKAFTEAARLQPENGAVFFLLGTCQLILSKNELAVASFDKGLKLGVPFPAQTLFQKGFAQLSLGQKTEAEKTFDQALLINPTNKQDISSIAQVYAYRWQMDKAIEQTQKAINLATDDDDSAEYSYLSWFYNFADQPQSAVIAANEAVQKNPKDSLGYKLRCRAYNELNQPDIAISDCKKVIELEKDDGEAYFYLGRAYRLKNDQTQADTYNRKAIVSLEKQLGIVKTNIARPPTAIAPKMSTNSAQTKAMPPMMSTSRISSLPNDAPEKLVSTIFSNDFMYILANAYSENQSYEKAVAAYLSVLEFRPKFARLRLNLGLTYLKLNRKIEAQAQYRELSTLDPKRAATLKQAIDSKKK